MYKIWKYFEKVMQPGYATYDVYLHYSSDIESILL